VAVSACGRFVIASSERPGKRQLTPRS
jgi:hypothetical protein